MSGKDENADASSAASAACGPQQGRQGQPWRKDPLETPFPFLGFNPLRNDVFLKGVVLGTGIGLVLGNPVVQRGIIRTVARMWSMMQGELEEMKERFRDAEAETRSPPATLLPKRPRVDHEGSFRSPLFVLLLADIGCGGS